MRRTLCANIIASSALQEAPVAHHSDQHQSNPIKVSEQGAVTHTYTPDFEHIMPAETSAAPGYASWDKLEGDPEAQRLLLDHIGTPDATVGDPSSSPGHLSSPNDDDDDASVASDSSISSSASMATITPAEKIICKCIQCAQELSVSNFTTFVKSLKPQPKVSKCIKCRGAHHSPGVNSTEAAQRFLKKYLTERVSQCKANTSVILEDGDVVACDFTDEDLEHVKADLVDMLTAKVERNSKTTNNGDVRQALKQTLSELDEATRASSSSGQSQTSQEGRKRKRASIGEGADAEDEVSLQ